MSRDDSALYTGVTSSSMTTPAAEKVKAKQAKSKHDRLERKTKIQPIAEPVMDIIQRHKDSCAHVLVVTQDRDLNDQEAGELLRSQRRIYKFLLQFETELKQALKETV